MTGPDTRDPEVEASRNHLSRLSEATLRINESLDFDNALQEAVDSARALTDARCRSHKSKKLLDALANDGEGAVVQTARQLSLWG